MIKEVAIILLIFLSGCGKVIDQTTDKPIEREPIKCDIESLIASNPSGERIAEWLHDNIEYKADILPIDEWRTPDRTILLGYADCDDYARLAEYIFYRLDIEAVCTYTLEHAVCQTKDGYISNDTWNSGVYPDTIGSKDFYKIYR